MSRADMTSVPVFPGGKKKQQPNVSLYVISRDTHTSPRPPGVLLGSGEISVLSLSPPAPFLGSAQAHPAQPGRKEAQEATDESQHLCPQGHQPQLSRDREPMGATCRGICTHLGKPRVPGALLPPQNWGHPDPKLKGLSSMGKQRGFGVVSCPRRRQMRGFSFRKGVMEEPPQLRAELAVSALWGNEGKDAATISWPERALKNGAKGR